MKAEHKLSLNCYSVSRTLDTSSMSSGDTGSEKSSVTAWIPSRSLSCDNVAAAATAAVCLQLKHSLKITGLNLS